MSLNIVTTKSYDEKKFSEHKEAIGEGGLEFENNGNVLLLMKNTTAESITVTIETPATFDSDLDLDDREVSVPGEDTILIGPFSTRFYNDTDGNVTLTVDSADYDDVEVMGFYR